ncbi:Alstrom syndrome protein 1 homolog a-like [Anopheles funestus]|uniref:Alstrom syndrome protein 1 homolog a-like n=1 Tax=Anopheles funestus TaxID=62324 RepID=UPI0020C6A62E|nr:Alstrom syndrome protein 1 homolog a-like [Anopheles funestus]
MSQSDRVTDLIMHYYMEHGRNRDLEKYLRLRRMSNATRSSSDGSLPCLDELQRRACRSACDRSGLGKSMENLSTLRKKAEQQQLEESEKSLRNASAESAKSVANKSPDKAGPDAGGSADGKGVTVRETKVEHKSGRNFNFNLESVIEINLPPPPTITLGVPTSGTVAPITYTQPDPLPQVQSVMKQVSPRIVVHENSTQTAASEDYPIRPVVKAHIPGNVEEPLDSTKDLSPVSSIASNKQKLEWDSLGDIGYDSSERLQFCGAADLNETEKRCLQRYFARKGLTFDRSVIVVRQKDEKERKAVRPGEDTSIMRTKPDAQSTPKLQPPLPVQQSEAREEAKSAQTSLHTRGRESRGIQVSRRNDELYNRQDKAIGTTDSYTMASVDAAESFEFFSPSVPETENNTPSVAASVSTPVHTSSNTSSSTANEASSSKRAMRPSFDDEVKLGLTLYNSICELNSMPTGVKESLIDKIFRKLSRHDPKRRTRQQLLHDYGQAVRKRMEKHDEGGCSRAMPKEESNVYDDVSPCTEKDDSEVGNGGAQLDRSVGMVEEVIEETKDPATIAESEGVSEGSVQASSSESNEGKNELQQSSSPGIVSLENSSHRTVSSQPVSAGTAKENLPRKMSAPEPRDRRVRKAMQEYLRPMTHSEVEYENFRQLRQLNEERANDPQLAKIDREIEQLLVKKMLLLNVGTAAMSEPTLPVKDMVPAPPIPKPLPSERSGTVYTSVHEPMSADSSSKDSSSAWNSHYHMAKVIKNRSKLETPTALTSTPSDVSIPTFIKQKKDKFVENYDQVRTRRAFEEQNHIYTRPYSSGGHRSGDRRHHPHEKENHAFRKDRYALNKLSKATGTDCRAISSSNNTIPSPEFISSDSISIPVVTTLTNTTTTHHYDIKSRMPSPQPTAKGRTAGTQTTDSILRTKPIFGEAKKKPTSVTTSVQVPSTVGRNMAGVIECNCSCGQRDQKRVDHGFERQNVPRRTEIINGGRQDKQAQTKPSSIAYVITFAGTTVDRKGHKSSSQPSSLSSESATESEPENGKDNESEKMLTLREQFRRSCPATLNRIEERRQCISELNKLRSKRNQQRQRLLLLTSDDSLRKTTAQGRSKLPPPPLSQRRVFASTRAIRENTRRQVRKLPEVQRKKEVERINNLKRKNRILKDVYNKNLQRKVLKGQVDLSNSVRVIQD